MGIKTQLNIDKWASVNILDVKFQVHLGAENYREEIVMKLRLIVSKIGRFFKKFLEFRKTFFT